MAISDKDIELIRQISDFYRSTKTKDNPEGSIRETSFKFGLNRNKIRKALVTSGEISSEITDEALKLRKQGLSIKKISKHLGVSAATVSIYLPYEDNIHNSLEPSQHTLDVRNYRAYEKARKQRMANKKDDRLRLYQSERDSKREGRDNMFFSKEPQTKAEKQLKRLNTKVGEYTLPNGLIRIHASLEGVDKKAAEIGYRIQDIVNMFAAKSDPLSTIF